MRTLVTAVVVGLIVTLLPAAAIGAPLPDASSEAAAASASAHVWQRWEHVLTSARRYGNQPDDITRRTVLARTTAGDLAVAYLPDNEAIEVDLSPFPGPLAAQWFDPVRGRYTPQSGLIGNRGTQRLVPPAKGDWVLLLQRDVASKQAISESGATSNRR